MTVVSELSNVTVQIVLLTLVVFLNTFLVSGTVCFRLLIFSSILESHRFFMARTLGFIGFSISGYVYPVMWIILPLYCVNFLFPLFIIYNYVLKKYGRI